MRQTSNYMWMKKINEFDLGRGNPQSQRNFIPVLGLLLLVIVLEKKHVF